MSNPRKSDIERRLDDLDDHDDDPDPLVAYDDDGELVTEHGDALPGGAAPLVVLPYELAGPGGGIDALPHDTDDE